MIKVNSSRLASDIEKGLQGLRGLVKDKQFAAAASIALAAGGRIVAQKAKSFAPKGGRSKKGQTKTYGKSGLLRKSLAVKKGVGKTGRPYSVVGPSANVSESVRRGRKSVTQRPSNYSHLVEHGFRAHHRVPLVSGRNHESIVKKGVLWKGSDLEKYVKRHQVQMASLTQGKARRAARFMAGSGQGSTTVPGQHFMQKAYDSAKGSIGSAIVIKLQAETEKAIKRLAAQAQRKSA